VTDTDWGDMASAGFDGFKLSHRDHALYLIGERDLDAQLIAIKGVLRRNRAAEQQVSEEIKALDAQIRNLVTDDVEYQIHMENHWVDTMHGTVFQDAAHSMSTVGMLAPFIESLFVSIFAGLRDRARADTNADPRSKATQDQFWNPQIVFGKEGPKDDIVRGITQLATSTGLQSFLPEGYQKSLSALFAYRNNMFHNGFEWPLETRQKFASRIKNDAWPVVWFSQATRGDDPWVFYMSDEFIAHCLQMIDQVLEGVGRYVAQNKDDLK
jgi:hypothetical protein